MNTIESHADKIIPKMPSRKVKFKEHYVNNKQFLEAITEYKRKCRISDENNQPRPRIPDYIGDCFLKIATRRSFNSNFINYPFRDEMISDGVLFCIKGLHNFNEDKYENPFAFFTQIATNAFVARIKKEKSQLATKEKILEIKGFSEVFTDDNTLSKRNQSDYDTIKDNIHMKQRYN